VRAPLGHNLNVPHDRVITYEALVAGARRHFLPKGTIDLGYQSGRR
jgi:hypothetical protein